jgi:hypothetical protein
VKLLHPAMLRPGATPAGPRSPRRGRARARPRA